MNDGLNETPKAAEAYREYASMGPARSLAKLADMLVTQATANDSLALRQKAVESKLRQLKEWSAKYAWVERAKAYDAEQFEKKRLQREADLERMNDEQALLGRTQALRAVQHIQRLIEQNKFSATAAVSLFTAATTLERVARGAATAIERQEQNVTVQHDDALIQGLRANPDAVRLAHELLKQATTGDASVAATDDQ